jgi:glycosyltransferase involved in cell wall biosynthesis
VFAWGKYGGFGKATRLIGRELVKRGNQVTVVVPRRKDQRPVEYLEGFRVIGLASNQLLYPTSVFKDIRADIYHSQEPSFMTYLAQAAAPERKHVITFRDTRNILDWLIELRYPSLNSIQVLANILYEDNLFVHRAVRRADLCLAASHLLIPKAKKKYHLKANPMFMPTPVEMNRHVEKGDDPSAIFISRLDRRKRPELFFELAKEFPHVHFIAAGNSRDQRFDAYLREKYGHLPNLEIKNFIDQFEGEGIKPYLSKSWILVNTSARESLPNTFIEAASSRCAILSNSDPDGFASKFGYHVKDGNFARGLRELMRNNLWQEKGLKGYQHVQEIFELSRSIDQHINVYHELLD